MTGGSGPLSVTAVVTEFPAPSQTFIRRKLEGLRDAGVDVTVAASAFGAGAVESGLATLPLAPWRAPRSLTTTGGRAAVTSVARAVAAGPGPLAARSSAAALAPLCASRSDIVHFEFSGIAVTYRSLLAQLRPARLAVSCRGAAEQIVPLRDPARAPQLREVFAATGLIHCVSDDIRRTVVDLGAPPDRIVVNRPAVPVERFSELARARQPRDDDELRVLSIGRLHWKKGLDDAVRAIARLADLNVQYRIAGEGAEREKLSFMVDELTLRDRVTLLGTCDQSQITEQLAWADVLLLPSLSEGISNAVLEAMAAGLAVVSTTCGGMREVIEDNADGLLVDVGSVDAMAARLRLLADRPELRARLGESAARRAVRDFDISRQISVFLDAYRDLLDRPPRPEALA